MSGGPRKIVFNRYTSLKPRGKAVFVYTDDPIVQFDAIDPAAYNGGREPPRNDRQRQQLQNVALLNEQPVADPVFGDSLDWPYRGFRVRILRGARSAPYQTRSPTSQDRPKRRRSPLGARLSQAVLRDERERLIQTIPSILPLNSDQQHDQQMLCLFNVIVALEWTPDGRYLERLEWAFRRASDFLYDVTNGAMAFGQVVLGGPELMRCADVQIAASNRLLPRSWVNGLHEAKKYVPIRLGRGLWHKNNRVTIAWEEPEAYRTIIHEWAHYALELKDDYLEIVDVVRAESLGQAAPSKLLVQAGNASSTARAAAIDKGDLFTVVVPNISLPIESIMATLEGTSELIPQKRGNSAQRKQAEWEKLAAKPEFSFLGLELDADPLEGPGQLPLPLPRFHQRLKRKDGAAAEPLRLYPPKTVAESHCWVYVIKGAQGLANPQAIIAQGTFDARAADDGLALFGAEPGDTIVLIDEGDQGDPAVWYRPIDGTFSQAQTAPDPKAWYADGWQNATPHPFPFVDVVPKLIACNESRVEAAVHVGAPAGAPPRVRLFPLGADGPLEPTAEQPMVTLPSLDGHVLLTWDDGALLICSYSQGGGPKTVFPVPPNPVAAGSSEGNALLFFSEDDGSKGAMCDGEMSYSHVRVVTTLQHGLPGGPPAAAGGRGAPQPRSYAFSLASSVPLPELSPTLIMFYDRNTDTSSGTLLVHHLAEQNWQAIETYLPPGSFFAAAPLSPATTPELFGERPRYVGRFRLFLT